MSRMKKTLATMLVAPALAFTMPACSGDQGPSKDTLVGKPPRAKEGQAPRDSSADDPNKPTKVTPERLKPGEGGEGGEEGGGEAPKPENDAEDDDADPSSRASGHGGAHGPGEGRTAAKKIGEHRFEGERHLTNLRMLTHGGQNAEAYLNPAESHLVFQSTRDDLKCDQIFTMAIDGSGTTRVSTGQGATTCAYFMPGGKEILYASTHKGGAECPPKPDFRKYGGYVWPIYDTFDIFITDLKGSAPRALTTTPGYDAEATISPKGDRIVFTSMRDGDLDIYTMKIDGSDVKRLTTTLGYDGGAFFSHDGKKIVYRAYHVPEGKEATEYKRLLAEGVVKPSVMEIFVMNADGSGKRKITNHGAASFAPFFHPSGKWVIFSSNLHDPKGRNFDLYKIRLDGSGLERITYNPSFDGFPMFTADGKRLIFASNRSNKARGETNVFTADWVD